MLQSYTQKAFDDARRDWDNGLQVLVLVNRSGCTLSLRLQTALNEAMTLDSVALRDVL